MDMKKLIGIVSIGSLASRLARKADFTELIEARLQQQAVARATRMAVLTAALTSLFVSVVVMVVAFRGGSWWRSLWQSRGQSSPAPPVAPSRVDPYGSAVAQPTIVE